MINPIVSHYRLLHLLHEADTTDETSDSAEMLGLEGNYDAIND